jgi:hypothetical protein
MADTRTLAGEVTRGEETVAPCPLGAVQANLEEPTFATSTRGVLAFGAGWRFFKVMAIRSEQADSDELNTLESETLKTPTTEPEP